MDDSHAISDNRAIRSLSNLGGIWIRPEKFSAHSEYAEYEPVLTTAFAFDIKLSKLVEPLIFQMENFVWFTIQLLLFYLFVRLLPGFSHNAAMLAAALYGFHPMVAETLNYALRRGLIMSSAGVLLGLLIWAGWRRLPKDFLINAPKVPKTEWDMLLIKGRPRLSKAYRFLRNHDVPVYLVPVFLGMLAGPVALAFPLILLAYIHFFDQEISRRRILPSAVMSAVIWIGQDVVIWTHAHRALVPAPDYWASQPLSVVRYLAAFFYNGLAAGVNTLPPVEHLWSPAALAGYAGLAGLIWLARFLTAKPEFKVIAFGLWWFLIGLLPFALMPNRTVEEFSRPFFAYGGLVLIVSRIGILLVDRWEASKPPALLFQFGVPLAAGLLLTGMAVVTSDRNVAWANDEALWGEAVHSNPSNGRATLNYAGTFMANGAADVLGVRYSLGFDYLGKASKLLPGDAEVETELAIGSQQVGQDTEAEKHFKIALATRVPPARAYSGYSQWLWRHGRTDEAAKMAETAGALNSTDILGRKVSMELAIAKYQWPRALVLAEQILDLSPDDADGSRGQKVSQAGIAALAETLQIAKQTPTADHYLKLSSLYFQEGKYEESLEACRNALKLDPSLAEAYANMSVVYHTTGKIDESINALQEAYKLRPDLEIVKNNLAAELKRKAEPR